jgi:hypothetical protein
MEQQCGASSWSYHELSLHSFFLSFPKLHVEVWFFLTFFILFGCRQFFLTLTTMIAYCPHKTSGEEGQVQIWTPNLWLHNHTL